MTTAASRDRTARVGDAVETAAATVTTASEPFAPRQVALVDLLDRLLAGGVVIAGELTLRIADVDLVRIHLSALIASIGPQVASPWEEDPR